MSDGNTESGEDVTEDDERTPVVDFRPALHMAGHEIEELGFEDIPDVGPVLHDDDDEDGAGYEGHVATDIATRGLGH